MTRTLSREDARRIAVRAQLLDAYEPESLLEVVDQLTLLQIDPTAAIAPNVDLVAWSRLGSGYDHADLSFAIESERSLIEFSSHVRVMDDVGLLLATAHDELHPSITEWVEANAGFRADIVARLDAEGPLTAAEIPDTCQVPWQSSGWNNDKNVVRMLEWLNRLGDVAISGREGTSPRRRVRTWDLAERVYPSDLHVPATADAYRELDRRRLESLGIARPSSKGNAGEEVGAGSAGEPCTIAGVPGEWRVHRAALEALGEPFTGRAALLSPFDRLVYDRDRAEDLFDFEYVLEMYKPAAKRRWGYFALPILHDDRLVGKLDAKVDRKKGMLNVFAVHEDFPWTPEIGDAVETEVASLADWLGFDIVRA